MSVIAPGLIIRNETTLPVIVVLSQLTPLHWARVDPNDTIRIHCGRVFFTVSVSRFDNNAAPSQLVVALRIAAIVLATVLTGKFRVRLLNLPRI